MSRVVAWLVLIAVALPVRALAAEPAGSGSGDEERSEKAAPPTPPPPAQAAPSAPAPSTAKAPEEKKKAVPREKDFVPATQSVSLDVGGGLVSLGGWAYPKIKLHGIQDPDTGFYAHGLGPGFMLHWDFAASDLDWRIGLDGTLPAYAGLEITAGIRKDLAPWKNPRLIARWAGGIEVMLAGGDKATDDSRILFLIPLFVGKGEVFCELTVVENLLSLGAGIALGVRYSVPLGVGLDANAFLRAEVWF